MDAPRIDLSSQSSQAESEDLPLSLFSTRNRIAVIEKELIEIVHGRIRHVKTINDLTKKEIQSKVLNGDESIIQRDLWNVHDLKTLLGAGSVTSASNSEWYVTDTLLDVYSTLALIQCKGNKNICILRGQFRIR